MSLTPGPWEWKEGHDILSKGPHPPGPSDGGLYGPNDEPVIFGVWCNTGTADCEASSPENAALVKAAPDLLESLRECRARLEAHQSQTTREIIKRADLAIARAGGWTP